MKASYNNFDEIDTDLKRLDLQRKIAWEELKLVKHDFKDQFKPLSWVQSTLKFAGKYGIFMILKRFITK